MRRSLGKLIKVHSNLSLNSKFSQVASSNLDIIVVFDGKGGGNGRGNPLLGPNKEFPFPGNVNVALKPKPIPAEVDETKTTVVYKSDHISHYTTISINDAITRIVNSVKPNRNIALSRLSPKDLFNEEKYKGSIKIDVTECPFLIKRIVQPHFASSEGYNHNWRSINVVNISPILEELIGADVENWLEEDSASVKSESLRHLFSLFFTKVADKFCQAIRTRNHWADFHDPKSGLPRSYTPHQSFLQYDEELVEAGFAITESGLCKIVENVRWSEGKLVGTIFTTATMEVIMNVVKVVASEFLLENIIIKYHTNEEGNGGVKK